MPGSLRTALNKLAIYAFCVDPLGPNKLDTE